MKKNRDLLELKNIGRKIARSLKRIGIFSEQDLVHFGAVGAHKKLREKYPEEWLPVCYYLYSFEGAIHDLHWNAIGERTKQQLKKKLDH